MTIAIHDNHARAPSVIASVRIPVGRCIAVVVAVVRIVEERIVVVRIPAGAVIPGTSIIETQARRPPRSKSVVGRTPSVAKRRGTPIAVAVPGAAVPVVKAVIPLVMVVIATLVVADIVVLLILLCGLRL